MSKPGIGQLIAGAGGALLIISLFLPWAEAEGTSLNGWELWTMADVFLVIAATMAIAALVTGGRMNLFRPDMSVNAAADLLGVVSTLLLLWLVFFDFPAGADKEIGVYLALIGAVAVMCGAGDWSVLRRGSSTGRAGEREVQRPGPSVGAR